MKNLFGALCCLLLPLALSAHEKKHHHDHHHDHHKHDEKSQGLGSHVHGEVELSLVSSENQLAVQLNGPAEAFIGFEYEAKTDEEKQKIINLKNQWSKNLFGMFSFQAGECKVDGPKIAVTSLKDKKGKALGHSTVSAEAVLVCPFKLSGQSASIKLREAFPRIKLLKIEALPENKKPFVQEFKGDTKAAGIEF